MSEQLLGTVSKGVATLTMNRPDGLNALSGEMMNDFLEAWHMTRTGFTQDHREAAQVFVEKREPAFKGR